jgi:undecaprenyl pyrophosphate synthase
MIAAIQAMLRDGLLPDQVNEETVGRYLYTRDLPDPDPSSAPPVKCG